jgi:zinc/manganese transport system permease protein
MNGSYVMNEFVMLLAAPFAACFIMSLFFGYLGLHVLKREVIFIDIALAQFAAVGAIIAHMILGFSEESPIVLLMAWSATLVAAALYSISRRLADAIPLEAVIGISYAAAAAGALFLIGTGTGGHTHIQEMLTGNLLWVAWEDVRRSSLVFVLAGSIFALFHRPLQRISDHYDHGGKNGWGMAGWDFLFYALCGAVITVAVQMAGVLVVFCFLIIPSTISALVSQKWIPRILIAIGSGIAASILGLAFAYHWDFSAGPSVSLMLGILLFAVWLFMQLFRRSASMDKQ